MIFSIPRVSNKPTLNLLSKISNLLFPILFIFGFLILQGCVGASTLSDDQITQNIELRIEADPRLNTQRLDIQTQKGVVTLGGTVQTEEEKYRLVSIVQNVKGVKSINIQVKVQQPQTPQTSLIPQNQNQPAKKTTSVSEIIPPQKSVTITPNLPYIPPPAPENQPIIVTDAEIISAIKQRLYSTPAVANYNIEVQCQNGNVTLSGIVDNIYDKEIIDNIANETGGVKTVQSNILVKGMKS